MSLWSSDVKPRYKLVRRLAPIPDHRVRALKGLRIGWTLPIRSPDGATLILAARNRQAFLVNPVSQQALAQKKWP